MYSRKNVGPRMEASRSLALTKYYCDIFVKKTSMPNPIKSLGYIKCYSLSSPRPKSILAIRKKAALGYYLQVFTIHRKKTNRVVVFRYRPFPNNIKYKDHCRDWIKWFGIVNFESFLICSESKTVFLQLFHEP